MNIQKSDDAHFKPFYIIFTSAKRTAPGLEKVPKKQDTDEMYKFNRIA